MTDKKLIQASLNGDKSAFEEIVKRYQSRVAATVNGMLGNGPEAQDIGQETFIRLYHSLERFRGESRLSTYITRIAINLSLNELKRRRRRAMFFIQGQEGHLAAFADQKNDSCQTEKKEVIHRAIQLLPFKLRAVVVCRLIEGYSTDETAAILSIPAGTVLSRLSRAQQQLRDRLAPIIGGQV